MLWLGGGEAFELLEVVDVVAGHGLYDGPEGHGSTFGMGGGSSAVGFGGGSDEVHVPVAEVGEDGEGGDEVVGGVALAPDCLVEGLDHGVGFSRLGCEGLAEAVGEDEFAVCEVGDDFAEAPLAGGGGVLDLRWGEAGGEFGDGCGGTEENGDGVPQVSIGVGEVFGVGVELHAATVSWARNWGNSMDWGRIKGGSRWGGAGRDCLWPCASCCHKRHRIG